MMKPRGTLYIISAPSGGGKTSLVRALIHSVPDMIVSVSHTTRPMRPQDHEGVDYYFVNEKTFESMKNQENVFLEYATVFGYSYGTSRQWVENNLAKGIDVILEIDWQGARQVRAQLSECIGIFILPPSRKVLEERLRERAQDKEEVITKRLLLANDEIAHCYEYDYLIINDQFEQALSDLQTIIRSQRLLVEKQKMVYQALLKELTNV